MDTAALLGKIHLLEKEIDDLKDELTPPGRPRKLIRALKSAGDFVTAYWVILALLIGLAVNWWFGVGFFEAIKNLGDTKKASQHYYHIGEKLMEHAEFAASADAFAKALDINPSYIDARHGLMRAQVLRPVGDSKVITPAAVETKLAYLREIFGGDDYILLYWEGVFRRQQSSHPADLEKAVKLFEQSLGRKPDFIGSHLELGNTYLYAGQVDRAAGAFEKALSLDKGYAPAHCSIGYCQLVRANLEADKKRRGELVARATEHLKEASRIAPSPEALLSLGDAFLYDGQYHAARVSHENALEELKKYAPEKGDPPQINLPYVFLPETPGQERDRGPALLVTTPEELKAFALYSLSFDHAALKEFRKADDYFSAAAASDPRRNYGPYFAYKMASLAHLLEPEAAVKAWLNAHIEKICAGLADGCKPDTSKTLAKGKKV